MPETVPSPQTQKQKEISCAGIETVVACMLEQTHKHTHSDFLGALYIMQLVFEHVTLDYV